MDCVSYRSCLECVSGECMWGLLDQGLEECRAGIVEFTKKVLEIVDDVEGCPVQAKLPEAQSSALVAGLAAAGAALLLVVVGVWTLKRKKTFEFRRLAIQDEERGEEEEAIPLEPVGEEQGGNAQPEIEGQVIVMELRSGLKKPCGTPKSIKKARKGQGKAEKERQD